MKSMVGGGALGLAAVFSPALSKPAAAAQSLEDLEADIMLCKVRSMCSRRSAGYDVSLVARCVVRGR